MTMSVIIYLFRAIAFIISCEAQCLGSEASLKVLYEVPPIERQGYDTVELHVRTSPAKSSYQNLNETTEEYPSHVPFEFEICAPKNVGCLQIAVIGPSKEFYKIFWDGQVIETGPELKDERFYYKSTTRTTHITATEFGEGCVPKCENVDEALFVYQYMGATRYRSRLYRSIEPYRVEDQNGNKIIARDERYRTHGPAFTYEYLYVERACLPKNDCYRFIMGDFFTAKSLGDNEHVSVSFDGVTVFESNAWHFESFDFGGGCPGVRSCNATKDSVVEFFMVTWPSSEMMPLSWELKQIYNHSEPIVLHNGFQPSDTNVTTLHYDRICVPQGSCLAFSVHLPNNGNDAPSYIAEYKLIADSTIYRKDSIYSDSSFSQNGNADTTYMGDCVMMTNYMCDTASEALLELNFETFPTGSNAWNYYFPSNETGSWYVSATRELDIIETFQGPDESRVFSSDEFIVDFELDSSYRVLQCIPSEQCLYSLFVHEGADFATYSIKLNGLLSSSDPIIVNNVQMTALNDECGIIAAERSLRDGSRLPISIILFATVGALMIFVALVIRGQTDEAQI